MRRLRQTGDGSAWETVTGPDLYRWDGESEPEALAVIVGMMASLLHAMNSSGVLALESQRTDPPTPFENVARAIDSTLSVLGVRDKAAQMDMRQRLMFELPTPAKVLAVVAEWREQQRQEKEGGNADQ